MKKKKKEVSEKVDNIVSIFTVRDSFITAYLHRFVTLSIYLLMGLVAFFIFFKCLLLASFVGVEIWVQFMSLIDGSIKRETYLWIKLAEEILNVVTFLLVLVKSFKILTAYSVHHHIEIKSLVEISIIALLMEVVFNFGLHSMEINILFAILGVILLIIYATLPYFRK